MKKGIDYVGIGIGAAILNREGKLFLARRGKKARNERGKWETPGGGLEFGETTGQTLKREMMEEFGIEVEPVELLGVYDHIMPEEGQHWVSISYLCRLTKGTPAILEKGKCEEIGWFTLEEADSLPLAVFSIGDIASLRKKYPAGMPDLYIDFNSY